VGGVAARAEGIHAMVSGTADGAGAVAGVIGGSVGGPTGSAGRATGSVLIAGNGGVAGDSAAARRRTPHFSQNLETAAFCAPHSSQN